MKSIIATLILLVGLLSAKAQIFVSDYYQKCFYSAEWEQILNCSDTIQMQTSLVFNDFSFYAFNKNFSIACSTEVTHRSPIELVMVSLDGKYIIYKYQTEVLVYKGNENALTPLTLDCEPLRFHLPFDAMKP